MKFYCDACNTKYAISDDKVRGKVLKVRCKNCGAVITVREAKAPVASSPTAQGSASAGTPVDNWYYSINGQTFGPFSIEALRNKYETHQISDASYVWHERIVAWSPVREVDAFKAALASADAVRPRKVTLGFTGPVQAISVDQATPSAQRTGAVPAAAATPRAQSAPTPEAKPSTLRTPETPDVRREKLERLRSRLRDEQVEPLPTAPATTSSPALPLVGTAGSSGFGEEAAPQNPFSAATEPMQREPRQAFPAQARKPRSQGSQELPTPAGDDALLTFDSGVNHQAPSVGSDVINFDAAFGDAPLPTTSSTSDILDRALGPMEEPALEGPADSGVINFPTSAPGDIGSGGFALPPSASGATSGSLLIQLDEIKKQGRGKRTAGLVVAGAVFFAVLGVGAFLAINREPAPSAQGSEKTTRQKDELVIRTYSKKDHDQFATLDLDDEMLFTEDEAALDEGTPTEEEQPPVEEPATGQASKGEGKSGRKSTAKKPTKPKPALKEPTAPSQETQTPSTTSGEPKTDDIYAQLLGKRATASVERPTDTLTASLKDKKGLTKDEARRGFRRVKDSIGICRERHNRHNAALAAKKIKVSLKVRADGRVAEFNVTPSSVQNTEFERCMQSHKERWRFAQFSGEPVVINSRIILP